MKGKQVKISRKSANRLARSVVDVGLYSYGFVVVFFFLKTVYCHDAQCLQALVLLLT